MGGDVPIARIDVESIHESPLAIHIIPCEQGEWIPNPFDCDLLFFYYSLFPRWPMANKEDNMI